MDEKSKKSYTTPKCFDLGAKSRTVTGQDAILGCFTGGSASGSEQCITGASGWGGQFCSTGDGPGLGDCVSGIDGRWYCEAGNYGRNDPNGCRSGMHVT